QNQRQKDVDLIVLANELDWDFPNRPCLAHAGVIPENVDFPALPLLDVIGVSQVQTFHADVLETESCGFLTQRRDLRRDLRGGDDRMALLCHADGGGLAKSRPGSGDENALRHCAAPCPMERRRAFVVLCAGPFRTSMMSVLETASEERSQMTCWH